MPAIKLIIYFLAAVVIASFAVQNMTSVEVKYYDFQLNLKENELKKRFKYNKILENY